MVGKQESPSQFCRAGEEILVTGLYRVVHTDHRLSHEAILAAGGIFPRCNRCGEKVHFELLKAVPQLQKDPNFRSLKLYEIPHPREEDQEERVKKVG